MDILLATMDVLLATMITATSSFYCCGTCVSLLYFPATPPIVTLFDVPHRHRLTQPTNPTLNSLHSGVDII